MIIKTIYLLSICVLQMAFVACGSDYEYNEDYDIYGVSADSVFLKDTLVIKDSVFLKDTLVIKDSVFLKDTLVIKDSVFLKDTLVIKDSVFLKDSLVIKDSVFLKDTLVLRDSVFLKDTLVLRDSVFLKDTLVLRDSVFLKDTLVIKDSVFLKDTLVLRDSVFLKDTLILRDSVFLKDTLVIKDSVFLKDTIFSKDTVVYLPEKDSSILNFSHFSHDAGKMQSGEIKTFLDANVTKNVLMVFRFTGNIESVSCGVSYKGFYGKWLEITGDSIFVKKGQEGSVEKSYEHKLILGDKNTLTIDKDGKNGTAAVRLFNDKGNYFSFEIGWNLIVGSLFIMNENKSSDINGEILFIPRDLRKNIWIFGDSYMNYYDPARWPYYIVQVYGFTNFLLDAKGGENSTQALSDLNNIMSISSLPSFIVWTLGMNDGSDSNNGPSLKWKNAVDSVISICKKNNVVPVFTTIPSVPSIRHDQKNKYLRSLDVRIIDFEHAVSVEGSYYWKWNGTEDAFLSSDNVHPTKKGAAAMAEQVLIDFPEISIGK